MRVAIDVSIQGVPEPTGVERAQVTLIDALLADADALELQLVLVTPARVPDRWRDHERVHLVENSRTPTWIWRETVLPRELRAHAVDVFHSPVAALPLRLSCPLVATLHELPWADEQGASGDDSPAHRLRAHLAGGFASRLLCVSERTAGQVVRALPDAVDRIRVVPHGVDPVFSEAGGGPAEPSAGGAASYVLAVGRQRAKKNFGVLLEAVGRLAQERADAPALVLVGPRGDASEELLQRAGQADVAGRITFAGFVEDARLAALYKGALGVLHPSRLEGFGLPVVEAMACGAPVLIAREGAVAEAAGDAVVSLGADDVEGWAHAMARLLDDAPHRSALVSRGREHAAAFRPARVAHDVHAVWTELVT